MRIVKVFANAVTNEPNFDVDTELNASETTLNSWPRHTVNMEMLLK